MTSQFVCDKISFPLFYFFILFSSSSCSSTSRNRREKSVCTEEWFSWLKKQPKQNTNDALGYVFGFSLFFSFSKTFSLSCICVPDIGLKSVTSVAFTVVVTTTTTDSAAACTFHLVSSLTITSLWSLINVPHLSLFGIFLSFLLLSLAFSGLQTCRTLCTVTLKQEKGNTHIHPQHHRNKECSFFSFSRVSCIAWQNTPSLSLHSISLSVPPKKKKKYFTWEYWFCSWLLCLQNWTLIDTKTATTTTQQKQWQQVVR